MKGIIWTIGCCLSVRGVIDKETGKSRMPSVEAGLELEGVLELKV